MVRVLVNGQQYEVQVLTRERDSVVFELEGRNYKVAYQHSVPASSQIANTPAPRTHSSKVLTGDSVEIAAPIPGVVTEILVEPGQAVEEGEVLLRIEAMKMQNNIFAPASGTVASIEVGVGEEVSETQRLLVLSP